MKWLCTSEPFLHLPAFCASRPTLRQPSPCPYCCGFVEAEEARSRKVLIELERTQRPQLGVAA